MFSPILESKVVVVKYHVRYHTNEKQRCVEQKVRSGNPRSKCLQATTHTKAKTMTQTLAKNRDKQA